MTITKKDRAILTAYADDLGCDAIRIKRDGAVHFRGPMPNATINGWYLAGHYNELLLDIARENARQRGEG